MSMIVRVMDRGSNLSMLVRVFGQKLLHEHDSASIWSDALT